MPISLYIVIIQVQLFLERTVVGDNNVMYPHPDDHIVWTTHSDIPEFKPFTGMPSKTVYFSLLILTFNLLKAKSHALNPSKANLKLVCHDGF